MDESYYAALLDDSNKPSSSSDTQIHLSIVLSRNNKTSSKSVTLGVAAKVPRKRLDCEDKVQYTIKYFNFLDDARMFSNLDALLTQLSPLGIVHLGCTESAEVGSKSSSIQMKRAREVSKLLDKVSNIINSRYDVATSSSDHNNSSNNEKNVLANVLTSLPKEVQSISSRTTSSNSINNDHLDMILSHLLGKDDGMESEESSKNNNYQMYKNDTRLFDDKLAQKAIMLLLQMEDLMSTSDEKTKGIFELLPGDMKSYMTMDRTAMECINLLPPSHAGISNVVVGGSMDTNSLFGILNRCKTKMGSRMLEMWLRQPSVCLDTIMYRQNAVGYMVEENGLGRDRLRDEGLASLRGVDLDGLGQKLTNCDSGCGGGTTKALECMYKLHLFADKQLPVLLEVLMDLVPNTDTTGDDNTTTLGGKKALTIANEGLNRVMDELSKSVQLVEAVLDFDAAPRDFIVKSSFSDELKDLKAELDDVEVQVQNLHDEMNETWSDISGESVGQVRLERDGKSDACLWQFRLPDGNKSKILEKELGDQVTIQRLLKNGVYFTTKALNELGSKKLDLMMEYEGHQRQIVQDAMNVAVTYVPVLERASQLIAELDVLASFAHVAAFNPYGYCKPEITDCDDDGNGISLKEARHPCVELQDNVDFIPNDIDLIYGSSSFLLVTGPNMGGKSTYIRSLGAIITMAQIGSYVPCKSAKINIVHHILARVGAGDLQDRGISTFMAEMLEASSILRTATKRSLIVIDELGRGTSTFDGYGLASAISEYIVQKIGCMTVFATHFHELTSLEETENEVKNRHVTAVRATDGTNGLKFLYEVRPGPCLESFGIQVAEMANVPKSVINDAKRKAVELENFDSRKRKKADIVLKHDVGSPFDPSSDSEIQSALKMLNSFKNLPLEKMSIDEQHNAVIELLA